MSEQENNNEVEQPVGRLSEVGGRFMQTDYMSKVVETDVGSEYYESVRHQINRGHILANRTHDEVEALKYKLRGLKRDFVNSFPPSDSVMVGKKRELIVGDGKKPLTLDEKREIEEIHELALSYITLGRDGFLQKRLSENIHVQRRELENNSESQKKGAMDDLKNVFNR